MKIQMDSADMEVKYKDKGKAYLSRFNEKSNGLCWYEGETGG